MNRTIIYFFCSLLIVASITGCNGRVDFAKSKSSADKYLAHVQLDSTLLLATEVVDGLEVPWDITVGPDGWIWFNEQKGNVSRVHLETGKVNKLLTIPDVHFERSRGLLSMVIHPEFDQHPYVFLHYNTFTEGEDKPEPASRLVRYTFDRDTLIDRQIILDNLPGSTGHNGSRMVITPDKKLWLGTGDALRSDLAQKPGTYHGKVLRMNLDGTVPHNNPIEGSHIWTAGHRNIQGITYRNNKVYISEHGPDSNDEVNLLKKGGNYGWPDVLGYCNNIPETEYCRDSSIIEPIYAWTPVIAPAGLEYYGHDAIPEWKNSLLLASLRIQTLRVLGLDNTGENVENIQIFFQQHFGRIRDVTVSTDGKVFLATSNMDWYKDYRPEIHDSLLVKNGDRIIMLQKENSHLKSLYSGIKNKKILVEDPVPLYLGDAEITENTKPDESLYLTYCSSCHGIKGKGKEGYVPSLTGSEKVAGEKDKLIQVLLNGISRKHDPSGRDFIWEMPGYRHLDDEEITKILNYLRIEFTGKTEEFTREEVAAAR